MCVHALLSICTVPAHLHENTCRHLNDIPVNSTRVIWCFSVSGSLRGQMPRQNKVPPTNSDSAVIFLSEQDVTPVGLNSLNTEDTWMMCCLWCHWLRMKASPSLWHLTSLGGCQSVRDSQEYLMSAHLPEGGSGFSSAEHSELKRHQSLRNTGDVESEACVWTLSAQTEASFGSYRQRIGRALC